jgi:hypothetical protein
MPKKSRAPLANRALNVPDAYRDEFCLGSNRDPNEGKGRKKRRNVSLILAQHSSSQDKPSANLKPLLPKSHAVGHVILFATAFGLCSATCLSRRYAGTPFQHCRPQYRAAQFTKYHELDHRNPPD